MTSGEKKRKLIFDKFSNNLHMLVDNKLIINLKLKYKKTYICPLCLEQFSEEHLDVQKEIFLTLEDVPPKSLGGHADILTCNKCNNRSGSEIDIHLFLRIYELEKYQFLPGSTFEASFEKDDVIINGIMSVSDEKKGTFTALDKTNNPNTVNKYNLFLSENPDYKIVNVKVKNRKKIDKNRIEIALLKIAYLSTFKQFGYLFILDGMYDVIRNQILRPMYKLYTKRFWGIDEYHSVYWGTHFVHSHPLESIITLFPLKTDQYSITLSAFTPLPILNDPVEELWSLQKKHKSLKLSLQKPYEGYLDNLNLNNQLEEYIRNLRLYNLGF